MSDYITGLATGFSIAILVATLLDKWTHIQWCRMFDRQQDNLEKLANSVTKIKVPEDWHTQN